jgi:hypothetical protein
MTLAVIVLVKVSPAREAIPAAEPLPVRGPQAPGRFTVYVHDT